MQVTGVQPVLATELAAAGASRRRRLQPGPAAVVGYRVLISIRASAAAASPALSAAVSSGASLSGAVTSAVTSAVSGGSLVQAIAAASPASVAALGYSSAAAMAASTTVDPTRPTALVAAAPAAVSGGSSDSPGVSGGGVAGIIIALLIAAAAAYVAHAKGLIKCSRDPMSSATSPPVTPGAAFQVDNPLASDPSNAKKFVVQKGMVSASAPSGTSDGSQSAGRGHANPVVRTNFVPSSAV